MTNDTKILRCIPKAKKQHMLTYALLTYTFSSLNQLLTSYCKHPNYNNLGSYHRN